MSSVFRKARGTWPKSARILRRVKGDLPPELLLGKKRGQGVVPGPAQKLHAARVGKPPKALQERLSPIFQLFKKHARDGAGNPEAATVAPDELEQGRVGRQVASPSPRVREPGGSPPRRNNPANVPISKKLYFFNRSGRWAWRHRTMEGTFFSPIRLISISVFAYLCMR